MLKSKSVSTIRDFFCELNQIEKKNFTASSILLLLGSVLDSSILLIVVLATQLIQQEPSQNAPYNYLLSYFRFYNEKWILVFALILICACFILSFGITTYVSIFSCNLVSSIASRKYDKFISMPYDDRVSMDPIIIKNIFTQTTYRIMAEIVNPIFRLFTSATSVILISTILYLESKETFLIITLVAAVYILIMSYSTRKLTKNLSLKKRSNLDSLLKYSSFSQSMLIDSSLYPECRANLQSNYSSSLTSYLKIDQLEALFSILPRNILEFILGAAALIFCFQVTNQSDYSKIIIYGLAAQKMVPSIQKIQVAQLKLSLNKHIFESFLNL